MVAMETSRYLDRKISYQIVARNLSCLVAFASISKKKVVNVRSRRVQNPPTNPSPPVWRGLICAPVPQVSWLWLVQESGMQKRWSMLTNILFVIQMCQPWKEKTSLLNQPKGRWLTHNINRWRPRNISPHANTIYTAMLRRLNANTVYTCSHIVINQGLHVCVTAFTKYLSYICGTQYQPVFKNEIVS